MNIDQAFPSTWLKNSDLNGRSVRLTMKEVISEEVGDDHKPVLYFQGAKKGLVLNKINSASIASAYGTETDNWNGKVIEVYPDMTIFGGKPTPCIRVRPLPPQRPAQPAAQAQSGPPAPLDTDNELSDSIPF